MTTNYAKYFCFLLLITQIMQQLNAVHVQKISLDNEKSTKNQLAIKQQKQQQQKLLQHKSLDETLISDVSVGDAEQQNYHRLSKHHISYDKFDDVFNDAYASNDDDDMENDNDFAEDSFNALSRRKRDISDWLIAPNTRWCGRGNSADGRYNHLGGASLADKCCRRHDHCKHFITGMSTRYELFNYRPYTLSHCTCDRRFRTCLKMANDEDAKTIGKLFFNMVQTQCFILRTEKICHKRAANGTCELEMTKKKAYIRTNKKF